MTRAAVFRAAWLAFLLLSLWSATASAQTDGEITEAKCIAAFDKAQDLKKSGALQAAKKELATCANAACPEFIGEKCVPWLGEVEAAIPTIVIAATGPDGSETLDVRVFEGETLIADRLTVNALPMDPGEHVLRFVHEEAPAIEKTIVLRAGEKNTRIEIRFESPPPPTPDPVPDVAPGPRPVPTPPPVPTLPPEEESAGSGIAIAIVGFALAGAGLLLGAIAGGVAVGARSDLDDTCATPPGCTQQDIDDARVPAHVSTGGFVVAGVGAAVGIVGLVVSF